MIVPKLANANELVAHKRMPPLNRFLNNALTVVIILSFITCFNVYLEKPAFISRSPGQQKIPQFLAG